LSEALAFWIANSASDLKMYERLPQVKFYKSESFSNSYRLSGSYDFDLSIYLVTIGQFIVLKPQQYLTIRSLLWQPMACCADSVTLLRAVTENGLCD